MDKKNKGNILLFPHVVERSLDLALEAREKGNFDQAKKHLEQVLQLENNHVPALLGLIATYFDLGRYEEARDLTASMLQEGVGDYSEVLQLYVISLVQLEEYGKVTEILSIVLEGDLIPKEKRKELEEILHTCSLLVDAMEDELDEPLLRANVEEKLVEGEKYVQHLLQDLDEGGYERQFQAIEQLKFIENQEVIHALRNYVILPHVDPVLKTFALMALKHLGENGTILVYKFDQLVETTFDEVPTNKEGLKEDQRKVLELVVEKTYHNDPMFANFALQLWIEYLFAAFPLLPTMKHTASWAAALHLAVGLMLHQSPSPSTISSMYGTTVQTTVKRLEALDQVLHLKERELGDQYLPLDSD